ALVLDGLDDLAAAGTGDALGYAGMDLPDRDVKLATLGTVELPLAGDDAARLALLAAGPLAGPFVPGRGLERLGAGREVERQPAAQLHGLGLARDRRIVQQHLRGDPRVLAGTVDVAAVAERDVTLGHRGDDGALTGVRLGEPIGQRVERAGAVDLVAAVLA